MHSLWKGSISFGLVNIPVKMYTASKDKEISFTLLHKKDLSEIRYARNGPRTTSCVSLYFRD